MNAQYRQQELERVQRRCQELAQQEAEQQAAVERLREAAEQERQAEAARARREQTSREMDQFRKSVSDLRETLSSKRRSFKTASAPKAPRRTQASSPNAGTGTLMGFTVAAPGQLSISATDLVWGRVRGGTVSGFLFDVSHESTADRIISPPERRPAAACEAVAWIASLAAAAALPGEGKDASDSKRGFC